MEIKAYVCPQCGAPLQVDENTTFTKCSNCGSNIRITYSDQQAPTTNPAKTFTTPDGVLIGTAVVPDNYEIEAAYEAIWHSELVPHYYSLGATRDDHLITMKAYSKEMFHDIKNAFLKGMIKLVDVHAKEGYKKFEEPEVFLTNEAKRYAGVPIKLTGIAELPSRLGRNKQAFQTILNNEINMFGNFVEIKPTRVSEYTHSYLFRFTGQLNGSDIVVLAGMDYMGAELAYTKPVFSGLFTKARKKADSDRFGHSNKHVDQIMFGTQWLYMSMFFASVEEEAQRVFFNFINSINIDPSINQREYNLFVSKSNAIQAQIARNQAIAQQNMRNLQINQQRLQQTLQENANAMSGMIMDSWNQKMASDSRISQARSEATMGVNTYTNSYGQNVQVSVVADHVYQNQHGDVYGVSGNELDQDLLNQINWTKLDK